MRQLDQEQVDALPDGTLVAVKWCGGNGPHRYRIVRRRDGGSYAAMRSTRLRDSPAYNVGDLDAVRMSGPLDQVWLVEEDDESERREFVDALADIRAKAM